MSTSRVTEQETIAMSVESSPESGCDGLPTPIIPPISLYQRCWVINACVVFSWIAQDWCLFDHRYEYMRRGVFPTIGTDTLWIFLLPYLLVIYELQYARKLCQSAGSASREHFVLSMSSPLFIALFFIPGLNILWLYVVMFSLARSVLQRCDPSSSHGAWAAIGLRTVLYYLLFTFAFLAFTNPVSISAAPVLLLIMSASLFVVRIGCQPQWKGMLYFALTLSLPLYGALLGALGYLAPFPILGMTCLMLFYLLCWFFSSSVFELFPGAPEPLFSDYAD